MKPQFLFFLISLFLTANVFGQNDVGFKATVTLGFISFKDVSRFQTSMADQRNLISPSGQIGMFYSHTFSNRSSIETDLLFNHVESRTSYTPNMQYDLGSSITPSVPVFNSGYYEENRSICPI